MLRFQNKYRSLLRSDPERVQKIVAELKNEGVSVRDPFASEDASTQTLFANTARELASAGIDPTGLMRELMLISRKFREYARDRATITRIAEIIEIYSNISESDETNTLSDCLASLKSAIFHRKIQ